MCGIAGFISQAPLFDGAQLRAMRDTLAHRGPDDAGLGLWDSAGQSVAEGPAEVGLAHRRLSIIDLTAAGHQPMSNEAGDLWITYNGEFYNFPEHRAGLAPRHRFASHTDTETILHLYEEHGLEETLRRMSGMFAFALWDTKSRRLLLARDRLGKKPLYYAHLPDGSLIFASEIKALLASGRIDRGRIDPEALVQFWTYGYTTGARTILRQVRRLLPGHFAVWQDGRLTETEYWDCPFGVGDLHRESPQALADQLEGLLADAIRLRLVSDVPVGLFLSGGIDSSLIAALTAKAAGVAMNTFTIGFSDAAFDEAPHAQAVAAHLGLPNQVLRVTEDIQPSVEAIARHFDEPFGDSSCIPTWFVAKLAREHVTVALTGDAGDELFAGYNSYAKALALWGTPEQRRQFASGGTPVRRLLDAWFRFACRDRKLTVLEMMMSPRELRGILSDELWRSASETPLYESRERWYGRVAGADLLSQLQYVNLKTYLPDDILVKVDRMSMAWALECRSPFLDHRVVEFAARLPFEAKIDAQGRRKAILRRILARHVPDHLINRPKMGFGVPWAQWCAGPLGDRLRAAWKGQANPRHRREAAARLFPRGRTGCASRQWNAYCALLYFEQGMAPS